MQPANKALNQHTPTPWRSSSWRATLARSASTIVCGSAPNSRGVVSHGRKNWDKEFIAKTNTPATTARRNNLRVLQRPQRRRATRKCGVSCGDVVRGKAQIARESCLKEPKPMARSNLQTGTQRGGSGLCQMWLPSLDSNQGYVVQSHACYRCTTRQMGSFQCIAARRGGSRSGTLATHSRTCRGERSTTTSASPACSAMASPT